MHPQTKPFVMRVFELDAQGRRELLEAASEMNARIKEIEAESAERSGNHSDLPGLRFIALPASNEQVAEMRSAESRKRGNRRFSLRSRFSRSLSDRREGFCG
jgi:hypothetical protein